MCSGMRSRLKRRRNRQSYSIDSVVFPFLRRSDNFSVKSRRNGSSGPNLSGCSGGCLDATQANRSSCPTADACCWSGIRICPLALRMTGVHKTPAAAEKLLRCQCGMLWSQIARMVCSVRHRRLWPSARRDPHGWYDTYRVMRRIMAARTISSWTASRFCVESTKVPGTKGCLHAVRWWSTIWSQRLCFSRSSTREITPSRSMSSTRLERALIAAGNRSRSLGMLRSIDSTERAAVSMLRRSFLMSLDISEEL